MLYRQIPIPKTLASELLPTDSTHILINDVELCGENRFRYADSAGVGDITYLYDSYKSLSALTVAPLMEWPEYNALKGCWYLVPTEEVRTAFFKLYKRFTVEHNLTEPVHSFKPNVKLATIYANVVLGQNVVIKPNAVIGGQAFSYFWDKDHWESIPHCKKVLIGDNVHIGSGTCIDAGLLEDTVIENDVKIDNLCHIAHDVHIGEHSLIIANSMIGGRTKIGKNCKVAPSTSILNGLTMGNHAKTGMHACVVKNIADNQLVYGVPARPKE